MNPASAPARASTASAVSDLIALAKPRITLMVLITTLGGLWLAPEPLAPLRALVTLLSVSLVVAGANALNMYLERDVDGLMERTRNRPLPAGRMAPEVALAFGLLLSAVAVPLLAFAVNPLTGFLAALSLVLYVLVYTPMKRRSTAALLIGAVPGAMPPLLGWTAATGSLDRPGLALFLILFLWQLPHFIAISMFRASEYERAGLKVVPVERGVVGAKQRILLYTTLLVAVSLQLARLHVAGPLYFVCALALGLGFVGLALYGQRRAAQDRWARGLFFYSLAYLPLLIAALVVGRT